MSEYRLVMKGVVKTFPGVKALDHAQLELRPGKVMALMGENGAGKSTLMKCMFGIYKMDEGEIEYEGEKVNIPTPLDALNRGIAMVHQELQPIPARTVAENIWLGRYPTKKAGPITIVDHAKMYKDTDDLLKKLKLDINSHAKLGTLSIAQMQMVEIAKAVSANCKVLILDEPTSSLTANEVESLFRIMRELKEQGVALVYISHKMDEIKVIADEVTIMRDGHYIGKWDVANMTKEEIIAAALEILRQKGMEAVNARAVAAALGCSTQPIFSNYSSMGALQHDVLAAGYAEYNRWIEQQMKEGQYPPYKASGMAYISFARRQPQLFKVLFMRDRTGEPQPAEDELTRRIIGLIMKNTGLEEQAAYTLHIELWIFIHGIASMLVTGYLNLEETVISTMVTDVYQGLLARKKEETA